MPKEETFQDLSLNLPSGKQELWRRLYTELRANSDSGQPELNFTANPALRTALEHIVRSLAGEVSKRNVSGAGPTLEIT